MLPATIFSHSHQSCSWAPGKHSEACSAQKLSQTQLMAASPLLGQHGKPAKALLNQYPACFLQQPCGAAPERCFAYSFGRHHFGGKQQCHCQFWVSIHSTLPVGFLCSPCRMASEGPSHLRPHAPRCQQGRHHFRAAFEPSSSIYALPVRSGPGPEPSSSMHTLPVRSAPGRQRNEDSHELHACYPSSCGHS